MKGMYYTEGIGWHSSPITQKSERPAIRFFTRKTANGPVRVSRSIDARGINPAYIKVPR